MLSPHYCLLFFARTYYYNNIARTQQFNKITKQYNNKHHKNCEINIHSITTQHKTTKTTNKTILFFDLSIIYHVVNSMIVDICFAMFRNPAALCYHVWYLSGVWTVQHKHYSAIMWLQGNRAAQTWDHWANKILLGQTI